MKIIPLAADSLGTRSMATFVRTRDCSILIDPGVRLAPRRFGLPPHEIELKRRREHWNRIRDFAKRSQILIVSHYHYDHHNPKAPSIFRGKTALLKDYKRKSNKNQCRRGKSFKKRIEKYSKDIRIADGKEYRFGDTTIEFSEPLVHGTDKRMGYVLGTKISYGDFTFVHTSDIVGCPREEQLRFLLKANARTLLLDGPLTYMMGVYRKRNFQRSLANLEKILERSDVRTLIIEHHLLREREWRRRMEATLGKAKEIGVKVLTSAQFLGKKNELLEANRKALYRGDQASI